MFRTKNCSEATQIENKVDSETEEFIKMKDEEFMKNSLKNTLNKLTLKTQQRFKIKRRNVFTEEINKISLSSNDDKKFNQLI